VLVLATGFFLYQIGLVELKLTFGSCPSSGFISVYQLSVMTQSFLYFEEICLKMFWQFFQFFSFGLQPPLSLY
jgi:hypothetical protein